jgi:hypothetical protein
MCRSQNAKRLVFPDLSMGGSCYAGDDGEAYRRLRELVIEEVEQLQRAGKNRLLPSTQPNSTLRAGPQPRRRTAMG